MYYKKEILQEEIDSLLGESINNIFYYNEYDGYETFTQLSNEIVEVPLLGILLETSSGDYYNIISYDYAPYYELGGIQVFRDKSFINPQGRPNQIDTIFWKNLCDKKITEITIIENYYKKTEENLTIPFGLKIVFEGEKECFITNMTIEGFIENSGTYDLCRGGGLLLFSGRKIFDIHAVMKENIFNI